MFNWNIVSNVAPVFLAFLALSGCRSKGEKSNTPVPTDSAVVSSNSTALSDSQRATLKRYLSASSIEQMAEDQQQWKTLETDTAFAKQFRATFPLMDSITAEAVRNMNAGDSYNGCGLDSLAEKILVWRPGCVVECMAFMYDISVEDLETVAKRSRGSADDEFVFLLKQLYGETLFSLDDPFITLFQFEWDYGGGTLSGNGESLKFLNLCHNALAKSSLFQNEIEKMMSGVVENFNDNTYMEPKSKVQAEIQSILDAGILPGSLSGKLVTTQLRNEAAPDSARLQFNCNEENAGCDFGG